LNASLSSFEHPFDCECHTWFNGLYEAVVIICIFPIIVLMAASVEVKNPYVSRVCKCMGDISYPMYLVNYPIIWVYEGWISNTNHTLAEVWHIDVLLFVVVIVASYASLKFYDEPVRNWLMKIVS